jgi:uncharacterized membrane protein YfcA
MMIHEVSTSVPSSLILLGAALLAGVVNGIAGGGGLIAFPALLFTGVQPVDANATNTAALWFGTTASTVAYRQELKCYRRTLFLLSTISVLGGILGAYILLHLSRDTFAALVPYLILIATLLFTIGEPLKEWLKTRDRSSSDYHLPIILVLPLQLVLAIYGGFFGGGNGILMLALLEMMGIKNIHVMNAFKSWLASCTNGAAIIHFILAGVILWHQATLMALGAILGGYGSAYIARKLHPIWIRGCIISIGIFLTGYFFVS